MKKKLIYRILIFGFAALLLLSAAAAGLVYVYQDKIIQLFITEANRHLKTKVEVGKIDLSVWDKFPQVAITVENVKVLGSLPAETDPLATGKKLYFTFDLKDVLAGVYQVREFTLEDGQIFVKVLPEGTANYLVFAPDSTKKQAGDFKFDLEKITLTNVLLEYDNRQTNQTYQADAKQLVAALDIAPEKIAIQADGDLHIHTILLNNNAYFKGKDVTLKTALDVLQKEEKLVISPSLVQVGKAGYEISGAVNYKNSTELDLKLAGKNTNIQSLLSLLPQKFTKQLSKYQSSGNVYFNGQIQGEASEKASPLLVFNFGCKNASFYHPEYKQKLENITFSGSFTNGKKRTMQTSVLELKNISGMLRGKPFSGNVTYSNFNNPDLNLEAKADLDIAHVLGLFPQEQVKSGSGTAKIQVKFAGNIRAFQQKPANHTLKASGDLQLQNANLALKQYAHPFTNLNGSFLLRKNDVAVSDFSGKLGSSDFTLNGYFKNALGWLLLDNQTLLVEADLDADFLNLDELLANSGAQTNTHKTTAKNSAAKEADYDFSVSPELDFALNANVKKLQFRKFKSRNLKGTVNLRDQVVSSPNVSFKIAGGKFSVKGLVDARSKNNIKVSTNAWLEDLRVDSLLYVFENFGQDFIQQRHLKGEVTSNINSDLYFDSKLNALTNKMEADIKVTIVNGQLVYFEPLQKLAGFADRSELANLQFSELTNNFWIQNRTIYIPEMEIRTNVSRASLIAVSGTHTFDQQMDYKFRIPLAKGEKKHDKDEAFGTIEETKTGQANLFLTLKGSENNYKVAYDQTRVKSKLKDDIQKEKIELTNALKGKKEPEKTVDIKQDEYFDF